jgi:hypothetical protein
MEVAKTDQDFGSVHVFLHCDGGNVQVLCQTRLFSQLFFDSVFSWLADGGWLSLLIHFAPKKDLF